MTDGHIPETWWLLVCATGCLVIGAEPRLAAWWLIAVTLNTYRRNRNARAAARAR